MYKVNADSLDAYFDADPSRKQVLLAVDQLIQTLDPELERWFYDRTADSAPGMKMKLIGYGRFKYSVKSGVAVDWPIIAMALQKNYISIYIAVYKHGRPIADCYAEKLGALKTWQNNFSFISFDQLDKTELSKLILDVAETIKNQPGEAMRYNRVARHSAPKA